MTNHAKKRILERYGKKKKKTDLKQISEGIQKGYYFQMHSYKEMYKAGITVIVKYNKEFYKLVYIHSGTIVTALPFNNSKNSIDLINLQDIADI